MMKSESSALEAKLAEMGTAIAHLLSADVAEFVACLVGTRFVANAELADSLNDAAVSRLKRQAREAGAKMAETLADRLRPESVWLDAVPPATLSVPISDHPVVADAISQVEASITAFLEAHHLPSAVDEAPTRYRLPARFIGGQNLPSLTRNYWKALTRLAELQCREIAARQTSDAEERRRRWDEA